MSNFKERFKDKAVVVGKDGEHQTGTAHQQQAPAPSGKKGSRPMQQPTPTNQPPSVQRRVQIETPPPAQPQQTPPMMMPNQQQPQHQQQPPPMMMNLNNQHQGGGNMMMPPPMPMMQAPPMMMMQQQPTPQADDEPKTGAGKKKSNHGKAPKKAPEQQQQQQQQQTPQMHMPPKAAVATSSAKPNDKKPAPLTRVGSTLNHQPPSSGPVSPSNAPPQMNMWGGQQQQQPGQQQGMPLNGNQSPWGAASPALGGGQSSVPQFGANTTGDEDKPKYKPYKLSDYQRINKPVKLGGLGPSDSDEVRFRRELQARAKEVGLNNNRINLVLLQAAEAEGHVSRKPVGPQPTAEVVEKKDRRAKALEFAKHVPKPKVKEHSETAADEADVNHSPSTQMRNGRRKADLRTLDKLDPHSEIPGASNELLLELEARHKRDQDMIKNIKRQLKF